MARGGEREVHEDAVNATYTHVWDDYSQYEDKGTMKVARK